MLAVGVSFAALIAVGNAHAQETQLPGIDVEGKAVAKKSSAPKAKAKAKPTPVAAAPAPEQDASAESESAEAAAADAPFSTPAGVSVVTSSELATFGGGDDINGPLRSAPGTFTRISPQNAGVAINIRGFEGSGRVNMSIDGVRQNFRFTGHEAQGFVYVDPLLVASVDIQRGAVSTAGGAGALAGTANMRTLDVQDILKPSQNYGSLSSVTWGSNGIGFSEMAAGAIKSRNISIAGAISKHDQHNYENADGVTVPFTGQDLISGLAKAHIQIAPDQQLSFGTVLYKNDFAANSYDQTVDLKTYTVKYAYNPANDLVDFRANFYGSDLQMNYLAPISTSTSAVGRVMEDTGLGFDVSNVSRFNLGAVRVRSEYGYEYFFDDVNVINSTAVPERGVNPSGESETSGLFSQTTFSYGIFDLIAGLRYDQFTINGSGSVTSGNPLGMPEGPYKVDRDDSRFDPKVTLSAAPVTWFQPYVTYSESMRAPTVSETLTGGAHPPTGGPPQAFFPNPFLEPEIQKGWEFGFNSKQDGLFRPSDTFRLKADYFMMDVDNYVTACFGPMGQIFFCNAPGESRVDGVELQGMYDAGIVFAGLSYTYTHIELPSQIDGFGGHSYLPEHTIVTSAGVRMFDQRLTIGGRVSYFSDSFVGDDNVGDNPRAAPYNKPFMPSYTVVDLFSNYKFDNGFELGLNINNLFNTDYTPALSTPFTGPPPASACFGSNFPGCNDTGMGRTYYLTAKAKF